MNQNEFDAFADEYRSEHARNIRASGEAPEFFHEYKVADVAVALGPRFPHAANFVPWEGVGPLPFPSRSFDVIFAACVFHHIASDEHLPLFQE